jgi:Fe2+ or Zn2+ uptake regulation protein
MTKVKKSSRNPEELIEFRQNIIKIFKLLKGKEKWASADTIRSLLIREGLEGDAITLEQIANNLRVLKDKGIVADTLISGKRRWSITGNKLDDQPPVKMVVSFPKAVHIAMCEGAVGAGLSRTAFIVECVKDSLSRK